MLRQIFSIFGQTQLMSWPKTKMSHTGRSWWTYYGKRICIYERSKVRGANTLKEARPPKLIRQTVLNCCFQIIDDAESVSKDPALRKVFDAEKNGVQPLILRNWLLSQGR
jgi:hypothetical protein